MSLIKNNEYSIKELFSTQHRKIIIPDFQRDYCWGNKDYGKNKDTNIVDGFIDTLFEEEKKGKTVLGKIDVYENPVNHINLTDGQLRLTTIYLLIGMLLRKADNRKLELKKCLLSDFEETDDKEPYLQYSIRESSLFFLRDLVSDFFIKENDLQVKDIEMQSWHFSEYVLDPTIQSFKDALKTIEDKLKWKSTNEIDSFSDFVLNDLKIQYYNVGERKHGEERFVIINTTGKGLTATENIKPILLGTVKDERFAIEWEERETFFWKNRIKDKELTSDNGVNEFMTWCFQIIEKQEEIDLVKISKQILKDNENENKLFRINKLFNLYKLLISYWESEDINKVLNTITETNNPRIAEKFLYNNGEWESGKGLDSKLFVVVPLLSFMDKISSDKNAVYQFLRRLRKNCYDYWFTERKSNHIDWRYILQIIEKSSTIDECLTYSDEFVKIGNIEKPTGKWFNSEEKLKVLLKKESQELIEFWEDHTDFMGDLSFLFSIDENSNNIDKLKQYYNNYTDTIDLIRSKNDFKPVLSNYFRLFRLLIGCNKVGHIRRASWDLEGVLFSTLNRNHLRKNKFKKLCAVENLDESLIAFCKETIKEKIIEQDIFNLEQFNVEKFIKAWLVLKVLNAERNNICLAYYDGRNEPGKETGVAAYLDKNRNILLKEEPFSLGNSFCGFGVRSGFGGSGNRVKTTNREFWLNPKIIDTPFASISFDEDKRTKKEIEENNKLIEELKYQILN